MTYYYEYRATGKRMGAPTLLPKNRFEGLGGFVSLFGFNQEVVDYISHTGATRGIGKFPLYADKLKLDFDNSPEAEKKALNWLREKGIGYILYNTGNRGHHIHIDIEPMERVGLAYYFEAVVKNVFPGADSKIYKPTGVIRLPGTYHAKTGHKMTLIEEYSGKKMRISDHYKLKYVPVKQVGDVDKDMLDFWFTRDLNRDVGEGDRNTHIFNLAATAMRLNIDKDVTIQLIAEWNAKHSHPSVRDSEMLATIKSAYGR